MTGGTEVENGEARLGEAEPNAAGQRDFRLTRLAVSGIPGSGTGAELLAWAGIDAEHIVDAARQLTSSR